MSFLGVPPRLVAGAAFILALCAVPLALVDVLTVVQAVVNFVLLLGVAVVNLRRAKIHREDRVGGHKRES